MEILSFLLIPIEWVNKTYSQTFYDQESLPLYALCATSITTGIHYAADEVPDLFRVKTPTQQLKHQTISANSNPNYVR